MATPKLLNILENLGSEQLGKFHFFLRDADSSTGRPSIPWCRLENASRTDTLNLMVGTYSTADKALEFIEPILRKIHRNDLADTLGQKVDKERSVPIVQYQRKLQNNVRTRYKWVPEALEETRNQKLLIDIYTEVNIIERSDEDITCQHEVTEIETTADTTIKPVNIFQHPSGKEASVRMVLTIGIVGIGKTFFFNKFILDWADKKVCQDTHLVFPFTFCQLNMLKESMLSLAQLVHYCVRESSHIPEKDLNSIFTALQMSGNSNYDESKYKVAFVLDGLDESRLRFNFTTEDHQPIDVTDAASVEVLMTNLIKGKLLPSARIWITTRPESATQIPPKFIHLVTEVTGFTKLQTEDFFRKRFSGNQANLIIKHINETRSLPCHIPVFCWVTAKVLKQMWRKDEHGKFPNTLTGMFAKFLDFQIEQEEQKYDTQDLKQNIKSIGQLAFHQLQEGSMDFDEEDLKKNGIDLALSLRVFKKEQRKEPRKERFSFFHQSIQGFFAAVHVVLSLNNKKNVFDESHWIIQFLKALLRKPSAIDVYKSAVDKATQSKNGCLDLFLRFLLGLSLETNQMQLLQLQDQLKHIESSSQTSQEMAVYIKQKMREDLSTDRIINLIHCLNELNDNSLVEEIQKYLTSGIRSTDTLSTIQWSTLVFVLLSSEEELDVFDLEKYSASEEGLLRLITVVKATSTAMLSGCNLSERCCGALVSVLSTNPSSLRVLDLSNNQLQDSGVKKLSAGLRSDHCRLHTLRLKKNNLTDKCCGELSRVLSCNRQLIELDLSDNKLLDLGVEELSAGLQSAVCSLETLRLNGNNLTEKCWEVLSIILNSNSSLLRDLYLFDNSLRISGVKLLTAGGKIRLCILQTLRLSSQVCHPNMDIASFTPSEERPNEYRFKFPRKGLFRCNVTGLVFGTTGGDIRYKTEQWEERWFQSTGKTPAGPLFEIQCPQESVCQLRLPLCDIKPSETDGITRDYLSVAHITDERVVLLGPQEVTNSHVMVNVTHLSKFGLLGNDFNPKCAQVLQFLQPSPPSGRKKTLRVFLLPSNVTLNEVKQQQGKDKLIQTDICTLTPNQRYRLKCGSPSVHVEPEVITFGSHLNYGPTYLPPFEVKMDCSQHYFSFQLLGPEEQFVWQGEFVDSKDEPEFTSYSWSEPTQLGDYP